MWQQLGQLDPTLDVVRGGRALGEAIAEAAKSDAGQMAAQVGSKPAGTDRTSTVLIAQK